MVGDDKEYKIYLGYDYLSFYDMLAQQYNVKFETEPFIDTR